jgi:class 3 adenylate cyclase
MASVLFMDIVGYSLEPMEKQSSLLQELQTIVRATSEFGRAVEGNRLISLPTGDGMALVFFESPTVAVECALSVSRALAAKPELKLRIGVHTGPVYRLADINANLNVAGGGINMAQRVMDCGDAGHILISGAVAEVLSQFSTWRPHLQDLGEHQVKHGVKVRLFLLCTGEAGNREVPQKVRAAAKPPRRKRWLAAAVATAALVLAITAAVWKSGWFGSSPAVPPPLRQRTLSYWVTVQKYREGKPFQAPFRLTHDINFEADYRIQLGFRSPQPGYLYLINEGPVRENGSPTYHVLFPSPTMNDLSPKLEADREVLFPPAGKKFIRFDEEQGTEKLWIVWANEDVPVLAGARQTASFLPEHGGRIMDSQRVTALEQFLRSRARDLVRIEEDAVGQASVMKTNGDILVYLRRLEHH